MPKTQPELELTEIEDVDLTTMTEGELIDVQMGTTTERRQGHNMRLEVVSAGDGYFYVVLRDNRKVRPSEWFYIHGSQSFDDFESRRPIWRDNQRIIRVGLRLVCSLRPNGERFVTDDIVTSLVYHSQRVLADA